LIPDPVDGNLDNIDWCRTSMKTIEFEDKMEKENKAPAPPKMSPYIFTILLIGFGLWCFWDGWLTTDLEMLEHALFNKVLSAVLLPWGVFDFFKLRKRQKNKEQSSDK
jgi:hypothetical protein